MLTLNQTDLYFLNLTSEELALSFINKSQNYSQEKINSLINNKTIN
jgi:hypothetical protein